MLVDVLGAHVPYWNLGRGSLLAKPKKLNKRRGGGEELSCYATCGSGCSHARWKRALE